MAKSPPQNVQRPEFGTLIKKATTETVNLSVGGVALLCAAGLHSASLLVLGGVAYGAMVAIDLMNPSYWKKVNAKKPEEGEALTDFPINPESLSDAKLKDAVQDIAAAFSEVKTVLAETPDSVKKCLGDVLHPIFELVQYAARITTQGEDLGRYLGSTDRARIERQIKHLKDDEARSHDEEAKKQYHSAHVAKDAELAALRDIESARERVLANLVRVGATLQGLPAQIVRMRALDAQALEAMSYNMNSDLDRVSAEIRSLEETLKSLEVPGR